MSNEYFPLSFIQGVTVKQTVSLGDYPASTWTMTWVFVQDGDQQSFDAVADGNTHKLTITKAQSAGFSTGVYHYQVFVDDGTERFAIDSGETEVLADFETQVSGLDARTLIRQRIEAIEAVLAGNASTDQQRVRFGDREIQHYQPTELIAILDRLKLDERRQKRRSTGGRIPVRFR